MLGLAFFIFYYGLMVAIALSLWEPDETVQAMLQDEASAFATALNVATMPPFYVVEKRTE